MFILKKIISVFLMPVGLVIVLWLVGAALFLRGKRRALGGGLMLAAGALLLVFSLPVVGQALLAPLENQAGGYASAEALALAGVREVVVLGGDTRQGDRPLSDMLGNTSQRRLVEGVRLWRGLPRATLIVSGGVPGDGRGSAEGMAALARAMGVPPHSLEEEPQPLDTPDEAALLARRLGDRPFALVTSAAHMPRALAVFRARGMRPVPAPTDFISIGGDPPWVGFLPNAGGLRMSTLAAHEYIGLLWARLNGWWAPEPEEAS